jgi:hypothetical protein
VETAIVAAISSFGTVGIVLLVVFLNPEKSQKWLSIMFGWLASWFRIGEKQYAALDVQGRINEFVKEMRSKSPHMAAVGVKVVWVDSAEKESPLREEGKLVIRMRRHEDQDKNFVQASMVFIASEFLSKTKRYLSKTQSESLDLFFAEELFKREKPHLADKFFDEYFAPATDNSTVADLLERYGVVEKVGLFFPVLVQELEHLGEKVYFKPKREAIVAEVNRFVGFLEEYANRKIGDTNTPTNFGGAYLRCGIVIIAKKYKREVIGDIEPYLHYVSELLDRKIETVYLIGSSENDNAAFMDSITAEACSRFGVELSCEPMKVEADIKARDGVRYHVQNHVAALRSRETQRVYDSEYQELYIDKTPTPDNA